MKACNIYFSEGCDGNKEKRGEKTGNNKFKDLLKKKERKKMKEGELTFQILIFPNKLLKYSIHLFVE